MSKDFIAYRSTPLCSQIHRFTSCCQQHRQWRSDCRAFSRPQAIDDYKHLGL